MTFARVNGGGWAVGDPLTSAQMNALDIQHANAVDKTGETAGTGGGVTGEIEFLSGASIHLDSGSSIVADSGSTLTGTLDIDASGNLIALSGAHIAINSGGFLTVNTGSPGGLLTMSGTLNFTSASFLEGTVGNGTLHCAGNQISLDSSNALVPTVANAINCAVLGGLNASGVGGIRVTAAFGIESTILNGIVPTVAGGITDGGIAGGIQVTAPDGLKVMGGATLDVENLGLLAILSGGQLAVESGGSVGVLSGAVVEVLSGGTAQFDAGSALTIAANTIAPVYQTTASVSTSVTTPTTPAGKTAQVASTVKCNGSGVASVVIPTASNATTFVDVLVAASDLTSGTHGLGRFQCIAKNASGTITNVSSGFIAPADQAPVLDLLFGGSPPQQLGVGGFGGSGTPQFNVVANASGANLTLALNNTGTASDNVQWTVSATIIVI